jgi:hypothetical protein
MSTQLSAPGFNIPANLPPISPTGKRKLNFVAAEEGHASRSHRMLIRARGMKDKMIKAQVDIVARELDVDIGIGGDT